MNNRTLKAGVRSSVFKKELPFVTYAHTVTAPQNIVKKTCGLVRAFFDVNSILLTYHTNDHHSIVQTKRAHDYSPCPNS